MIDGQSVRLALKSGRRFQPKPDTALQFGRYRVEAEVGRGGMGVVYRARDTKRGRTVALKVMVRQPQGDGEIQSARFEREARVLKHLRHPSIPKVYDYGEDAGLLFLVTDFLEGETLDQAVHRPASIRELLMALREVAKTLHYAHGRNILHRDVKPENIILTPARPFLVDFGLAKDVEIDAGSLVTGRNKFVGTPAYLAPEQINPDMFGPVGPLTDVRSLGATLFYCVTGRYPFEEKSPGALFRKIVTSDPVPLSELAPHIPKPIDDLCRRALARQPYSRPRSAEEFAAALDVVLERDAESSRRIRLKRDSESVREPKPSAEREAAPAPGSDAPDPPPSAFGSIPPRATADGGGPPSAGGVVPPGFSNAPAEAGAPAADVNPAVSALHVDMPSSEVEPSKDPLGVNPVVSVLHLDIKDVERADAARQDERRRREGADAGGAGRPPENPRATAAQGPHGTVPGGPSPITQPGGGPIPSPAHPPPSAGVAALPPSAFSGGFGGGAPEARGGGEAPAPGGRGFAEDTWRDGPKKDDPFEVGRTARTGDTAPESESDAPGDGRGDGRGGRRGRHPRIPRGGSGAKGAGRGVLIAGVAAGVIVALIVVLVLAPRHGHRQAPVSHPAIGPETTIDQLADLLRYARSDETDAKRLIRAFADSHRPETGQTDLISNDGRVHIVIGAHGRDGAPDGKSVRLSPRGTAWSIAVAGDGADALWLGAGGRGGDARSSRGPDGCQVVVVAGLGGSGADPGKLDAPADAWTETR